MKIISGAIMLLGLAAGAAWGYDIYTDFLGRPRDITHQIAGFVAFLSIAIGAYIFGRALENFSESGGKKIAINPLVNPGPEKRDG